VHTVQLVISKVFEFLIYHMIFLIFSDFFKNFDINVLSSR